LEPPLTRKLIYILQCTISIGTAGHQDILMEISALTENTRHDFWWNAALQICIPKRVLGQCIKPGAGTPVDLQRARAQSRKRDISTEPAIMILRKLHCRHLRQWTN
jgi:hypothetical protein